MAGDKSWLQRHPTIRNLVRFGALIVGITFIVMLYHDPVRVWDLLEWLIRGAASKAGLGDEPGVQ